MDWESLKFFLAVAREGTLAAAGRTLGVRHSTVLRRIALLEDGLGLTLFDRHPTGYMLTAAGREMLESLTLVDETLVAMERRLSGRDLRLGGTVRIAALGVLVPWICDCLAELRALHPGIRIEVIISPAIVSLARHEADIAIRVGGTPPESLIGRRIATLLHGIYAAEDHPATRTIDPDLASYDWVSYNDSRSDLPQTRWVAANIPRDRVVIRSNHTGTVVSAARAGLGLALLPCYLGDAEPGLRRLKTIAGLGQEMWVLTHGDLRRTPRVRAVMDFLARELLRHRDLIEGRMEPDSPDG
ncbi:LysR family transcriptional regulator [Telmatospirillum sp.]|uniref:LysR family transcriptional regulator n=1 Tax=Telmatospirillum sp. TaxID=2079197 RepID=UPI0028489602|nr:LysR family transcriptional regulator [Telmatospirillum sp.]MDR3439532.1 LysR family transcriptional regulator [Telmatospirillum sp.]